MSYWTNQATTVSQAANSVIGGDPNMTLSARVFVAACRDDWRARLLEVAIDRAFFWQQRHCRGSWERDVEFADKVLVIRHEIGWPR